MERSNGLPLRWRILGATGGVCLAGLAAWALITGATLREAVALGYYGVVGFALPALVVFLGLMQYLGNTGRGRQRVNGFIERRQVLEVDAPPAKVLAAARAELGGMGKVTAWDVDSVTVTTRMSLWSMGEIVTVGVAPTERGSKVLMTSRPVVWTTLIDYGTNQRNLDRLGGALLKLFTSEVDERAVRRRAPPLTLG